MPILRAVSCDTCGSTRPDDIKTADDRWLIGMNYTFGTLALGFVWAKYEEPQAFQAPKVVCCEKCAAGQTEEVLTGVINGYMKAHADGLAEVARVQAERAQEKLDRDEDPDDGEPEGGKKCRKN